jgi:hypothetical protein
MAEAAKIEFSDHYSRLNDDQLKLIATDFDSLVPVAREALNVELAKRGLPQRVPSAVATAQAGPSKLWQSLIIIGSAVVVSLVAAVAVGTAMDTTAESRLDDCVSNASLRASFAISLLLALGTPIRRRNAILIGSVTGLLIDAICTVAVLMHSR